MSASQTADRVARFIRWAERTNLPDVITKAGIWLLCERTARRLAAQSRDVEQVFVDEMLSRPVAEHTESANDQHYELPAEFFVQTLGPRRKYSCCLYPAYDSRLAAAEEAALAETVRRANLQDGQDILELGCGWGSLSLYLAEHLPRAQITAVSNSSSQKAYIEGLARQRRFSNLSVITADMNMFDTKQRFDRIVSVEMFEHMANWDALLSRLAALLNPEGRLFVHVFTHSTASYRFDHANPADWIAQHFFTGGMMPAETLMASFPLHFEIEEQWRWSGSHYARTARDWLANFDSNIADIRRILRSVYGADAKLWERRWRLFYLATEGLFGHRGGAIWGVSHYRLKPTSARHADQAR